MPTCPSSASAASDLIRCSARSCVATASRPGFGARAFDLLVALVERRDRVVSKNELLDLVWPRLVVEENNLQVHVAALRKLLGARGDRDDPGTRLPVRR